LLQHDPEMIPKKPALGLDPRVGTGFRKRSCSNNKIERDDDSKKSNRALMFQTNEGARGQPPLRTLDHERTALHRLSPRGYSRGIRPLGKPRAAFCSRAGHRTQREARMGRGHRDKVAVITGAAKGIGQAFAQRLAADGVHIVIADVETADETVKLVEQAGREALACRCDVTSPDAVAALAAQVERRFGRCDILVNCAGVYPQQAFEQMTFADWRRVLSINLDGLFLATSAFVPGMKRRGWGRIVNLASSTLGSVVTGFVHYVASKGGIVGFTRALASELGPHGITVNAISPGLTRTPGTLARAPRAGLASMDEEFASIAAMQAIKRVEVPDDLVGVVSFLTSEDAAFMTGQTLNVDGGRVRS
jgi:NAD(P)-dependent dehydrogenase (short-subunit alcohol dehydrogenase family)